MMAEDAVSVVAVLPAAGNGSRMQISQPKQFCLLRGRPVISHTICAFEQIDLVRHIIVVVAEEREKEMRSILQRYGHNQKRVKITIGADTRHRSISKGISSILKECSQHPDVVVIHDGVRPFVPEDIVIQVVEAAQQYGAAGAVRPLVSTVIKPAEQDGRLEESLERSRYRNSEMPQAFRYSVITEAYDRCSEEDYEHGTECLRLAHKYSDVRAKLIEGPDCLWKITHKKDLTAAEEHLKNENLSITVSQCENAYCQHILQALRDETSIKTVSDSPTRLVFVDLSVTPHVPHLENLTDQPPSDTGTDIYVLLSGSQEPLSPEFTSKVEEDIVRFSQQQEGRGCVYGVLVKGDESAKLPQIISVLSMLIKDRNISFSGQTFKL